MKIFIFGAGFTSRAFLRHIPSGKIGDSSIEKIWGTTRSEAKAEPLRLLGATPILFDGENKTDPLDKTLQEVTHLLVSISPGEADPVLKLVGNDLLQTMPNLKWTGYLSTVGVYGNHNGAWVDETTPCRPVSKRSKERLSAEKAWTVAAEHANIPLSVFRLSGIYGRGRNTFKNFQAGKARRLVKKDQVFNRIMASDIASALELAMAKQIAGLFNITDDEPAPPQDVVTHAAQIMGVDAPPELDFETADLTPMARSFYGENKRVSNAKAKAELGWIPKFPNYRIALEWLWHNNWDVE